jgi:hypothetical protein
MGTNSIHDTSRHGESNPADEVEAPDKPTEFIAGKWRTKSEFFAALNEWIGGRVVVTQDEHYEGKLYMVMPFAEEEE